MKNRIAGFLPATVVALTVFSGSCFVPSSAMADGAVSVAPLFKGGKTILDQGLGYRQDGPLEISSEIIAVAPQGKIPEHMHLTPFYAYILEGEITVTYANGVENTYKQGQAMLEAINIWHHGVNNGDVPVKILVVNMGVEGVPNTIAR
jgi:quercetin dioxygenase-like cupin family protein